MPVALRQHIRQFGAAVADELFPAGRSDLLDTVERDGWHIDAPGRYCSRCGASAGPHATFPGGCPQCVDTPLAWRRLTRLSSYREPVSDWIRAMKFGRDWAWAATCGELLAQQLKAPPVNTRVAVCPVPMHWLRRIGRGYNQAQLLAHHIARTRGWPLANILHRTRYTPPQTSVSPSRRRSNVHRSFAIDPVDLAGWHIVLVDDVLTTGATLGACARLLRRAKAESIEVAVIAVAEQRR